MLKYGDIAQIIQVYFKMQINLGMQGNKHVSTILKDGDNPSA